MTEIATTRPTVGSTGWVLGATAISGAALFHILPVAVAATLILCVAALAALAVWDLRTHRLPNTATATLSVAGLVAAGVLLVTGQIPSIWPAFAALAGFGVLGFVEALPRDSLGGGDVKLLAAVGVWTGVLGWQGLLPTLLCTHVAMLTVLAVGRAHKRGRVALGPAIAVGTAVSWVLVGLAA